MVPCTGSFWNSYKEKVDFCLPRERMAAHGLMDPSEGDGNVLALGCWDGY